MLGVSQHMDPKLFGREIIFEEFKVQTYLNTVAKRYGQTDGRTDGRTDDMQSHHRALR